MIFRVLDIETVVDDSAWTRGSPTYRIVPSTTAVEGVRAELVEPFPPPHACRVVAISCADVGFDPARDPRYFYDSCWSDCRWAPRSREEADAQEAVLLAAFAHAMETAPAQLVTWNGRGFDLPVLAMRSLRHKLAAPWYYKERDVRYRYSTEGHLDLMDFLSDYGGSRNARLGDVARICGLPGKTDMSGDKVADLWLRAGACPGEDAALRERVARYCLQDVLQTALVFVRTLHLRGKVTAETCDAVLETFRASPEVASAIEVDWDRLKINPPREAS